ncbi:MAG TPA: ABC transporter ATP-binding protein [Acidimicrobiia bacterium]
MTESILKMRRVGKTHGRGAQRVDALVDIDLDVAPGEFVAITGRSGSGKTTLLNIAGALDEPTTGNVWVEGNDLGDLSNDELARVRRVAVGYVFQQFNLLPALTAAENVALPLELDGMEVKEARAYADLSLEEVGLGGMGDRYPDQLSGGEQQRVAIARGLVGPRTLLLADEPTGALDEATGESILKLLRDRCELGASALMVTHEPVFAAWADRVVRLRDGQIEEISVRSTIPSSTADIYS